VRLLAPAAATVLLLALTGCSEPEPGSPMPTGAAPASPAQPSPTATATAAGPTEQPGPTAAATQTSTPAPTAAATQTSTPAPTLPPEATTNDAAGAEAFVRYWYDAFDYAVSSGDTAPLREASLYPECLECDELAALVEDAYAGGGRLAGGQTHVVEAVSPTPDKTGVVLLSVVIDQEPISRLDGQGALVDEGDIAETERSSQSVVISRGVDDANWRMVGLGK